MKARACEHEWTVDLLYGQFDLRSAQRRNT
jgi:hypothetical protein